MNDTANNPLDPQNFYAQNVQWVSESAQLLKTNDVSALHRFIALRMFEGRRAQDALLCKTKMRPRDREQGKALHHRQQVLVPAFRRSLVLLNNAKNPKASTSAVHTAAVRLAVFLLGMVAQSSLFPRVDGMHNRPGALYDASLPGGLNYNHRSLALTILREHAHLFGACPAWVEPVVVNSRHMSAEGAMAERQVLVANSKRRALRNKIINLGVLTADEEQLLMRVL